MEKQLIQANLEFLKRTQLQGAEVNAFAAVVNELNKMLQEEEALSADVPSD